MNFVTLQAVSLKVRTNDHTNSFSITT